MIWFVLGVYKTVIDATEHKATVTGTVSGETLVQKLLKSGKHAEILPESFKADDENQKKKKKQGNNKKGEVIVVDDIDEKMESEDVAIDGNDVENDEIKGEPEGNDKSDSKDNEDAKDNSGGGGKKKKNKKKKKGEKDENKEPTKNDIDDLPTDDLADEDVTEEVKTKNVEPSMEQLNLGPQMVYAAPQYDMTPYANNNYNPYYPTPGYGVSYNTSYPGAESSYYTPPVYGYAQSHHPAGYYPPPPPPRSYYPRSAFDDHYDESEGKGYCAIMWWRSHTVTNFEQKESW